MTWSLSPVFLAEGKWLSSPGGPEEEGYCSSLAQLWHAVRVQERLSSSAPDDEAIGQQNSFREVTTKWCSWMVSQHCIVVLMVQKGIIILQFSSIIEGRIYYLWLHCTFSSTHTNHHLLPLLSTCLAHLFQQGAGLLHLPLKVLLPASLPHHLQGLLQRSKLAC